MQIRTETTFEQTFTFFKTLSVFLRQVVRATTLLTMISSDINQVKKRFPVIVSHVLFE